jgi:hypothetical protein
MLDSPERVCAGRVRFEYPATSVPFSSSKNARGDPGVEVPLGVAVDDREQVVRSWRPPAGHADGWRRSSRP